MSTRNALSTHSIRALVLAAALLAAPWSFADFRFFVDPHSFDIGATGQDITVSGENSEEIQGFSVAMDYDPAVLEAIDVTTTGVATDADFKQGKFENGRITFGVVLDFDTVERIPPAASQPLLLLTTNVLATAATTTEVAFRDERFQGQDNRPDELNIMVSIDGVPVQGLQTTNGTVTIVDPAAPVPDAPTCLLAASSTSGAISMSWVDNSGDETGFDLERRVLDGGDFEVLTTLPADTEGYTDDTVSSGILYEYRVNAKNGSGVSDFSNVVRSSTKSFELIKAGKGKLSKKGWGIKLGPLVYDGGPIPYQGDGSEIRVFLGSLELFADPLKSKFKQDKLGNTLKGQIQDANKNKLSINFAKGQVKIGLKGLTEEQFDADGGFITVTLRIGESDATLSIPTVIERKSETKAKAFLSPSSDSEFLPLPEANPCGDE